MIQVKHATKRFIKNKSKKEKEEFLAVNDISFTAEKGEIVGILGPNGAGKTTLLRMTAGIMHPTSGSICYDDFNFEQNEIEIKSNLAYLSGNTKIYNTISAYELLKMCGDYYEVDSSLLETRIHEIATILSMESFLYNRISNLSTGQTQRVNIARCLIHNPNYYIFDEATSGLDIISSQIILDFMKEEKKKGKCILYSTHYMEEAENICDRIIMIDHGTIIAQGTPDEIKNKTKTTNLRDAFFALLGGKKHEQ